MCYSDVIVTKHGGYNMATPYLVEASVNMIKADPRRRFIVVSAPGSHGGREKVTDLLLKCYKAATNREDYNVYFRDIEAAYRAITDYFGIEPLNGELVRLSKKLDLLRFKGRKIRLDWVASRGEYFMAKIMAQLLDAEFIDSRYYIKIGANDQVSLETYELLKTRLDDPQKRYVIPGFYGSDSSGQIKTFSRGGSDITASIVAKAVNASVYENVKEVSGVAIADPRLISSDVRYLDQISYGFMAELAARGAEVLNWAAVYPVEEAGIPILFRSINDPELEGTRVTMDADHDISAIAGHDKSVVFRIHKPGIGDEVGFGAHALELFKELKISIDHLATGENDISIVVVDKALKGKDPTEIANFLIYRLGAEVEQFPIATISVVSEKRAGDAQFIADILKIVAETNSRILLLSNVGAKSLVVGVERSHYQNIVCALYDFLAPI